MKTDKYQNKYRIPTARAVWHDYNGGDYFITICTAGREHYFGEINNGEMVLNVLGQKLDALIGDVKTHNPYCEIPLYQIMPNHVHLIVCIDTVCVDAANRTNAGATKNEKMRETADQCGLLSTAIGGLKAALTKYANSNKIEFGWQTRFHDRIIRDQDEMNMIARYVENNVTTWDNDKFYTK